MKLKPAFLTIISLLTLFTFLLPACATPTTPAAKNTPFVPTQTPTPTEIPTPSTIPFGTYYSERKPYRLIFNADGTWSFLEDQAVMSSGTYSVQDGEVTWLTDSYCDKSGTEPTTYMWTFTDDNLVLKVKGRDTCVSRNRVIDSLQYVLEK